MNSEEFSVEALHALVDAALTDNEVAEPAVQREGDQSISDPGGTVPLPFTLLNMDFFGDVAELVGQHCDQVTTVSILDELRHRAFAHLDTGRSKTLYGIVSRCRKCDTVEDVPTMPIGARPNPDLLVIHELPMREHMLGQRLVEELTAAGFDPTRVMHTSVVRCDPSAPRGPNETETANCRGYLFAEIQLCVPKLILCLGATAYQGIVGPELRITIERGNIFYFGPWAFLPTYSLGYLLRRNDHTFEDFKTDLRTAAQYCYGTRPESGNA